jgi:membrane glycosyltransferase
MNTSTPPRPSGPATAPPIERSPMRASPWFGVVRGLLFALLPGLQFALARQSAPAWQAAAQRRRRVLLLLVATLAAGALALQIDAAPDEVSGTWLVQTTLVTLLFAWVGAGFFTALMGAWVLLRGDRHALRLQADRSPIDRSARTAVIMPICNEDVATVFGGLRATCESLAATGALALFDIYVLSDTADPALRAAELRAWERMRSELGDDPVLAGGRVFYRWRRRRTKRKAGNVADFCRRWGRNYRYMVVLDADSTMHGDTLVSLVRLMEQHPRAGIVQTLPQACGHHTLHARLQQFGSRVTGRLFALGMAYWQLGESHYWGHNAILRVEPFMRHCALAAIPGRGGLSGEILSHDFVEAAMMRRAGYEVWLAPDLGGSWEQNPSNLLDELQRDRRWCQGNLQNARLLAEPGWRPVHRVMLATGALSYLVAPLWLGFVVTGLLASREAGFGMHSGALWVLTLLLLLLPRLLGVLAVRLRGEQRLYGGSLRLGGSALLELLLSALQAPLRMLAHSAFVLGALTGLRLDWKSPARDASAVGWRDALARIGLLTLPALGAAVLVLQGQALTSPYWLPLLLPLLLAIPFTVLTGNPRLGLAWQRAQMFSIPEERHPPRALARATVRPTPTAVAAAPARPSSATFGQGRMVLALGSAALFVVALLPRPALSPELSPSLRAEQELVALVRSSAPQVQMPELTAQLDTTRKRPVRTVRERPARMIDDAVRQRAYEAVARALEAG